jgi:hypothetical protein
MVNCSKCQKIVRKTKDGQKVDCFKCINGAANTFRTNVTPDICSSCILVQNWDCHCIINPPTHVIFNQPIINEERQICYTNGEPPCPYGYEITDDPLKFSPLWPECVYLEFANELNDDGTVKIKARCAITSKLTSAQTCRECEGDLNAISPKEYPSISAEISTYIAAVKGWIQEGRPTRSDEEVAEIHQKYCSQCDWFDAEQQRCKDCGCKAKAEGSALLNKIRMKTQHCPKQLW